jgi:hypothetical protein
MVSVGVAVLTIRNEMKQKTSMGMESIAGLTSQGIAYLTSQLVYGES